MEGGTSHTRDPLQSVATGFIWASGLSVVVTFLAIFLFIRSGELSILLWSVVVPGFLPFGVLMLISGLGLRHGASWARAMTLVTAVLLLIVIPIGTALGVWALVALLAPHKLADAPHAPGATG